MVIRQEQMAVFRNVAAQSYEDEIIDHLKSFAAKLCEIRGDSTVRKVVQMGIARSMAYGFVTRGPVRLYIDRRWPGRTTST